MPSDGLHIDRRLWHGITPILVMPYDDRGRIRFDGFAAQVDYLAGLDVVAFGIGLGSDILRLTERERDEVVAWVRPELAIKPRQAYVSSTSAMISSPAFAAT